MDAVVVGGYSGVQSLVRRIAVNAGCSKAIALDDMVTLLPFDSAQEAAVSSLAAMVILANKYSDNLHVASLKLSDDESYLLGFAKSGEARLCIMPLIIERNDGQGFESRVTVYGLSNTHGRRLHSIRQA